MGEWTLFSNHGHVLVCLARDNEARLRNVAEDVGITERAVQKIVRELQQAGFISIQKRGRCNRYGINTRQTLRHALEARCPVGRLLQLFTADQKRAGKTPNGKSITADTTVPVRPQAAAGQGAQPKPQDSPQVKQQDEVKSAGKKRTEGAKNVKDSEDGPQGRQQGSLF